MLHLICLVVLTIFSACRPQLEDKRPDQNMDEPMVVHQAEIDWRRGANIAWLDYGSDFGGNPWTGDQGLRDHEEDLDMIIEDIIGNDIKWLRWFVLPDLRSGVLFDETGVPLTLNEHVIPNLQFLIDKLPEDVFLMPTILDFHFCSDDKVDGGVQIGGHCELITDDTKRAALNNNIIKPLVAAFEGSHQIAAWDIINEPDWLTSSAFANISSQELDRFLKDCVTALHESASQPITIGLASEDALNFVEDIPVDILQFHWYPGPLFGDTTPDFSDYMMFEKPVILGEYPGNLTESHEYIWQQVEDGRLSGAAFWRAHFTDDDNDQWSGWPAFSSE